MILTAEEFKANVFYQKLNPLEKATIKAIFLGFDVEGVFLRPDETIDYRNPKQVSVGLAAISYEQIAAKLPETVKKVGMDASQCDEMSLLNMASIMLMPENNDDMPRIMDIHALPRYAETFKSLGREFNMQEVLITGLSLMMVTVKKTAPMLYDMVQKIMVMMGFKEPPSEVVEKPFKVPQLPPRMLTKRTRISDQKFWKKEMKEELLMEQEEYPEAAKKAKH